MQWTKSFSLKPLTVEMHSHVWGGPSNWTCTYTSCHILCLDISASLQCAFCNVIGGSYNWRTISHKNTRKAWSHCGLSYDVGEMNFVQTTCNTLYIQTSSHQYGQPYAGSDSPRIQMPSHIQSIETSLVYGQPCVASDPPFVQTTATLFTFKLLLTSVDNHVDL